MAVAAVLAVLVGGAAWLIGVSGPQSTVLAAAVMTVAAGFAWLPSRKVVWPTRRRRFPPGTRTDLARLSWVMVGRRGTVTGPAVPRLLALAQRRLARAGVDLHDSGHTAAAERLLGPTAYRVLGTLAGNPARPVRYAAFVRCLAAVERLGQGPEQGPGRRP